MVRLSLRLTGLLRGRSPNESKFAAPGSSPPPALILGIWLYVDDEEAMVGRLEDLVAKLARPGEGRVRWSCHGHAVAESIIRFVNKREKNGCHVVGAGNHSSCRQ